MEEKKIEVMPRKQFKEIMNKIRRVDLKERLLNGLEKTNLYRGIAICISHKDGISKDTIIVENTNFKLWVNIIKQYFNSNLTHKSNKFKIVTWFWQDDKDYRYDSFEVKQGDNI